MKFGSTMTLIQGANPVAQAKRGQIEVRKGYEMTAQYLKVSVPVTKSSAGNAALTDAQKQTLLGLFWLNLTYGFAQRQNPFAWVTFATMQRIARRLLLSEIEGYADAVTGLATVLVSTVQASLVFYLPIPTGVLATERSLGRKFWGIGPTQASTMQLDLRQIGTVIGAPGEGLTVTGNVSIQLAPKEEPVPAGHDRWAYFPEYAVKTEGDYKATLPEGLPLAISETSAVHASTALTNVSLSIGDRLVHDQVAPGDITVAPLDDPFMPAAGLLTDRETLLYQLDTGAKFSELPAGEVTIKQNKKDLATMNLAYLFMPIVAEVDVSADVAEAAALRKEVTSAVSLADVLGVAVPMGLRPFCPLVLVGPNSSEFEAFPGLTGAPGVTTAHARIPVSMVARAKAAVANLRSAGEHGSADNVLRRIAASIPGAVQSTSGFGKGPTPTLNAVAAKLA